ncbi:MAG: hypothetical protein NC833_00380 [Candidatus Omnitrophica bacterium]|nr:hypothetical protein [Candidatus Omnitrophota bacterium]
MEKLKYRFLWTWDHSTNWSDKNISIQEKGSRNPYHKNPDIFLEDYYLLIDFMKSMDLNGLIIWGFLRDSHGGISYARKIIEYAHKKNIKIIPGIGLGAYGGIYYDGENKYNLRYHILKNPGLSGIDKNGNKRNDILCPSKKENIEWYLEGINWLFDNFQVDGVNLETGDYGICWCNECKKRRGENETFSTEDIKVYLPIIEKINKKSKGSLITVGLYIPPFDKAIEEFLTLPEYIIPQWRLTEIIEKPPINYIKQTKKFKKIFFSLPQKEQIGFFHQGSQWFLNTRHECVVKSIYNGVKLARELNLSGLITHGEVSSKNPEWFLNYLAFSYFTKFDAQLEEFSGILNKYTGGYGKTFLSLLFSGTNRKKLSTSIDQAKKYLSKFPQGEKEYILWYYLLQELYRRIYLLDQWR